jgi:UDP-glucose 4-epimerase
MKTKILITGVAGFIGSNLLDYLIQNTNWEIDGIDNLSTGSIENISHILNNNRFNFINNDLINLKSIKSYDFIFHLAALPRIQPSYDLIKEHINHNLISGAHILQLMIEENKYPKLIYSSSSSIYGNPEEFPTTEESKISCLSPYAFQKYEFEKYLELLSLKYPLNYVNLRYFNPYGPRSFNPNNKFNAYSSVIGIFLNAHKNGEKLKITGSGLQKRDFIHVYDLSHANYLAAVLENVNKVSINIGSGNPISVLDIAKKISKNLEFIEKRIGEAEITHASISLAKYLLNWEPTITLDNYLNEIKK